ncbi:MAG TPA: RNA polymerase sigma factor [Thermoanaerobaculia bacterium]|nr:RNA polymerase sigma factor [Thermoanaerobaculia bacterium]
MAKHRDAEYEELYRKHYARTFRFYVQQFRLAHDLANDLAQETFIRIYRSMDTYRDGGWSFVETIARNVLYNYQRAQRAGKRYGRTLDLDDPDTTHDIAAPHQPDFADRDASARNWRRLRQAIAGLPDTQRPVIELQLQGLKYEEIAARMSITLDAVKTRRKEALKRLRRELGDVEVSAILPEEDHE